ncbi:MAG: S8 family serine peptidase [Candidatus Acidiferrales bacterium]
MKYRFWILTAALIVLNLLVAGSAGAQQQLIVRTTSLPLLKQACLLNSCQITGNLDGTLDQLFLVTVPNALPLKTIEGILKLVPGVVDVEVNSLLNIGGSVPLESVPNGLYERSLVNYYGAPVWTGYAQQPASAIIQLPEAQSQFSVSGKAIVADIDTGVDFTHPALHNVLLQGYDFTRNQPGGNEMADVSNPAAGNCSACQTAGVDQSSAAVLDQSTAAVLDQSTAAVLDSPQYQDFGHGTMVLGVVHMVAPTAQLMPLKSFSSNGTGDLSNILAAIYYAVQNHANVINMSFDFGTSYSNELAQAIAYAEKSGVVCVASAGNEGESAVVYPAGLAGVMGVGSTNDTSERSSFSNYGSQDVWVAAPGENIISTYPYDTYASESGTSFSAPMVSGTAALIFQMNSKSNSQEASAAIAQAQPLASQNLGHGLLNVHSALAYIQAVLGSQK